MYLEYYKLNTKPFQITTDPRFLWLGENHKEALAVLKYGIMDNRGLVLLTGDVGIGKTTLINALIEGLGDDVIVASLPDPNLDLIDLLTFIAKSFGIEKDITSKGEFLSYFNDFLKNTFQKNKKALLIIDESQKLRHDTLEEIRLLSNIEQSGTKLLNIFLVGQNEFNDILWEERNRALRQRITVRYGIHPLSKSDTSNYINHRLKIAGSQKPIFSRDAIREVISFAEGLPRAINIICDRALLAGYVKGATKISAKIVKECANDLKIPQSMPPRKGRPGKTKLTDSLNPTRMLRNAAYASIVIMLVFFAVSFFMGKNIDSSSFSFNLFNRTTSVVNEETSEESLERPPAVPGQDSGVFHTIDASTTAPQKSNGLSTNKRKDTAGNTKAPLNQNSKLMEIPKKIIIYFAPDSNEFTQEAIVSLDLAALILKYNPRQQASSVGYTDDSGVYSYNKEHSRFRANFVKSYLVGKGVDPGQVKCIGMGPGRPADDDDTSGKKKNRHRVEIVFN